MVERELALTQSRRVRTARASERAVGRSRKGGRWAGRRGDRRERAADARLATEEVVHSPTFRLEGEGGTESREGQRWSSRGSRPPSGLSVAASASRLLVPPKRSQRCLHTCYWWREGAGSCRQQTGAVAVSPLSCSRSNGRTGTGHIDAGQLGSSDPDHRQES